MLSSENSVFIYDNLKGIQLLTRLRVALKHLRDTLNPICSSDENINTSCYYLLQYSCFTSERLALLNVIRGINNSVLEVVDSHIVDVLLHQRKSLDISRNTNVLNPTIGSLFETKRFDKIIF